MEEKVKQQLKELGSKIETPPSSKDSLLKLLKQAAGCLAEMDQSPSASDMSSMQPLLNAIVKPELLKHQDRDVNILVASCICEITRITAPNPPYDDDVLKDIFNLIVGAFSGLSDTGGPSFGRRVVILETLAKYRSCIVLLDLECDDLVNKLFSTFFTVASDDHQENVLSSMQTIMVLLIEESEDVRKDLLLIVLSVLGRKNSNVSTAARKLAMNVIEKCAVKLEAGIKQFLTSSMSGDSFPNSNIDYHEVIYDVYCCAPQILSGVIPYITGELLTDDRDIRLKAVGLVGDLFALPGSTISEAFQPIFSEFLKRLSDRVVAVRMSVLEHVKSCLLSNPLTDEASQIISALCDRLLDYDENVRKQVVDVICNVACHSVDSFPIDTIKLVAERLRDKSILVKKYTMERLAEIFRVYCMKSSTGLMTPGELDWIPGRILRCFYDKDFRSDTVESFLSMSLFPTEFSVKDRVTHWIRVFSVFDSVEVKVLERILEQKQRLQQEMQRYLSLRQMHQDGDASEIQKKVHFCFRVMSRSFAEPTKAEENFQILDQLKDANVWKILTNLLDPSITLNQACAIRSDSLKILGEKHRLYDFLSNLSVKCSYILFNKEHVKEMLLEAASLKSTGNMQATQSCMDILVILARFSPILLCGAEEDLVNFLKDDNEIVKEGALHILAKAGGIIREQLPVSSSAIDLILERLCVQGSRRQAKYAVHALAAITKDDGLKSLSVLYKRLVDMLEEKRHLPAVLQSLGCIAEAAMPVFETREGEIKEFIHQKILECSSKVEDNPKSSWDDRSELCFLKIYGIKTLVKSYLPAKDAQLRRDIDGLLGILKNMLLFGEVSKDIESSSVDKTHLKLAAAKSVLRLSKQWDHKIPVDLFYLTLKTPEIAYPQARKLFLSKVHRYIKDRLLDAKYASTFVLNLTASKNPDFEEEKQNLGDIIHFLYQTKARQVSAQNETNPLPAYPEYILSYLVHALAHISCPNVDECKDVEAYEPVYRKLHLFLSMLVHKYEDAKSELSTKREQETISEIVSIFQSIKCSEDVVDAAKSKNSHAISELGLSITTRLVQKDDDLLASVTSVPLPVALYKLLDQKGDDSQANDGRIWLAEESVLTRLESLKLQTDQAVVSDVTGDEVLQDSEREENEVPLGKMIKLLKSKRRKSGQVKKDEPLSTKLENDGDVDILKMVREINLDNLGLSGKFESSNGHKHSPIPKTRPEPDQHKDKKRKVGEISSTTSPKRPRSSSAHNDSRLPKSKLKSPTRAFEDDLSPNLKGRGWTQKVMVESSSRKMGKSIAGVYDGKEGKVGESNENKLTDPDVLMDTDDTDLTVASTKKRKRKSITGLAKCTTKDKGVDIEELIGHRIRIWWPMDKKFYEGTVKSFDPLKRKHVILYDDGDVEVLRLEKERWELVDKGGKPRKKANTSKKTTPAKVSPVKKEVARNQKQQKEFTNIVKGRRTPKKKRVVKIQKDKEESDLSDDDVNISRKGDDIESDESLNEETEKVTEENQDEEESDNDVMEQGLTFSKVSDVEDSESNGTKSSELSETASQDGEQNDAAEVESHSEGGKEADESSDDGEEKLDSGNENAEISDDEPLLKWKHKAGKSASRKAK